MKAPTPQNEPERLAALDRYGILDTPREAEFDGITRLVARLCDVPFAVINLIAEGRQWFKAEIGFGVRETPLESSFCAHAILQEELFVVPDTTKDERFDGNPLVTGEPNLRFYAGSLLKSDDGFPLGTLCVLDTEPRTLSAEQVDALEVLSEQVMKLLELRRQLALQADLTRQLNEALETRERILAVVSHDLRSPLGTVVMTAEMLREISDDPEVGRAADRLDRASGTMRRLVDDLLDYESMRAGKLSMQPRAIPVRELLERFGAEVRPAAEAGSIALEVVVDTDASVRCDPMRIQQALVNLATNALSKTPAGGEVSLRASLDEGGVALRLTDTGPGFAPEVAERLFEPFWRGEDSRDRGAGLGLAITKGIVEQHGGRIAASSAPGAGATFTITLPAAAP